MAEPKRRRAWSRARDVTDTLPAIADDAVSSEVDEGTPDGAPEAVDADARVIVDVDATVDDGTADPSPERSAADAGESAAHGEARTEPDAAPLHRAVASRVLQRVVPVLAPRVIRLSASLAAGLMVCASFPPFGWWYLTFVAFALLAWVITHDATTKAGGFGYGFLFGLAFYVPLLPWISGLVGAVPWLMLAAMEALFPAVFGVLAVVVRRLPGWPLWFACLWVLAEWLKSVLPFGGFTWGAIGFSQDDSPLLVIAHFGGAPLVSFAVVLIGFSLSALGIEAYRRWHADDRVGPVAPPAVLLPGVCVALVFLTVALANPYVRKSGVGAGEDPTTTVAAVQGNVPRLGLDFNAQRRAVLDNHVNETLRLADDIRAGRAPQPAVVIWPENSSDIDPIVNRDAADQIALAADAIRAPILVGTVLAAPGYTRKNPAATNTVIVWDGASGPGERHDKQIIQPFGEYLPWRGFFRLLSSYADRAGYFVPGSGNGVVHAAGIPIGITTCWEVIFDRAARESVLNGAQFLAVPANNATFNEAMSAQQLGFARLRAVEHDRFVVVAGTTGISAIIGPDGRTLARTQFFEPAYLDSQIRLKSSLTPATRWGPIVQGLLVFAGAAAVLAAMLHNGEFVRRRLKVTGDDENDENDEKVDPVDDEDEGVA